MRARNFLLSQRLSQSKPANCADSYKVIQRKLTLKNNREKIHKLEDLFNINSQKK